MEIKVLYKDGSMSSASTTSLYSENGTREGVAVDYQDVDLSDPEVKGIRLVRRRIGFDGELGHFVGKGPDAITLYTPGLVKAMLWVCVDGMTVLKRVRYEVDDEGTPKEVLSAHGELVSAVVPYEEAMEGEATAPAGGETPLDSEPAAEEEGGEP